MRVREHIMNSIFSNDEMTILNNKYQQLFSMFNKPKKLIYYGFPQFPRIIDRLLTH